MNASVDNSAAWASLITCGEKDVENRTWTTRYRGVLAVHAGYRFDQDLQPWQGRIVARIDDFPQGAIIGVAELMEVVRDSSSRWAEPTCYHWVLANPRPIELIPMPVGSAFGPARSTCPGSDRRWLRKAHPVLVRVYGIGQAHATTAPARGSLAVTSPNSETER